jgi:hypothetical protein
MNLPPRTLAGFRRLYSVLPAAFTALLAIGLTLLSRIVQPLNPKIIDTHVHILGLQSTRLQFLLYALCSASVVGSTIIILLTKNFGLQKDEKQEAANTSWTQRILAGLLVVSILSTSGNYKLPYLVSLAVGMPLLLFLVRKAKMKNWINVAVVTACFAYLAGAYLIPLIYGFPVSGADYFVSHETHHAVSILPGIDIVRGQKLQTAGGYYYGFIMPVGATITTWLTGLSSSDPLITVRTVQLFNIIASLLVIVLVYIHLPSQWKWLSLLSLPLLPSLSLAHSSISHPNQAGIRYITLLIGLLVLTAVNQRQEYTSAWILGLTGGVLMGLSLELGVSVNAGYVAYILVRTLNTNRSLVLQAASYTALAFLAFMGTSWTAMSALTSNKDLSSLGYFVSIFGGSGYGGYVSTPSFLAIALFFAASSIIVSESLRVVFNNRREDERDNAFSCGIAMMILAWLPYYVNRMSEWNLWIMPLLLLLLATNYMEGRHSEHATGPNPNLSVSVLLPLTLAATFVGARDSSASMLRYFDALKRNGCELAIKSAGGYCKSEDIIKRTARLNEFLDIPPSRKADYLILSPFHDTSARIAGFNRNLPWYATISAITMDELRSQSKWIDENGPQFVVVPIAEASDSFNIKERIRHLRLIIDGTASYSRSSDKHGWSVFRKHRL